MDSNMELQQIIAKYHADLEAAAETGMPQSEYEKIFKDMLTVYLEKICGITDTKFEIEFCYDCQEDGYDINLITDDVRVATAYNTLVNQVLYSDAE